MTNLATKRRISLGIPCINAWSVNGFNSTWAKGYRGCYLLNNLVVDGGGVGHGKGCVGGTQLIGTSQGLHTGSESCARAGELSPTPVAAIPMSKKREVSSLSRTGWVFISLTKKRAPQLLQQYKTLKTERYSFSTPVAKTCGSRAYNWLFRLQARNYASIYKTLYSAETYNYPDLQAQSQEFRNSLQNFILSAAQTHKPWDDCPLSPLPPKRDRAIASKSKSRSAI